jgi:hemerythrin-like metal-binding protein
MDTHRIQWSEALRIGEPVVDQQHQRLIEMIEGVPDQPEAGDEHLLPALLAYAGRHFADEEALMAKAGYPGLADHRMLHKTLTRTLLAYRREFEAGHTDAYHLKQFVFRWIRDHIMDEDASFGRFLRGG